MVRMIDMFPEAVRKKLDFFNKDKYTIATEEVDLKEKKKYGEVCLKCKLNKDTLIFMEPEKNKEVIIMAKRARIFKPNGKSVKANEVYRKMPFFCDVEGCNAHQW